MRPVLKRVLKSDVLSTRFQVQAACIYRAGDAVSLHLLRRDRTGFSSEWNEPYLYPALPPCYNLYIG